MKRKIDPSKIKLTREEQAIERMAERGELRPIPRAEFNRIAKEIASYRKDAVISIRVNNLVLQRFKAKAKKLKVPYQTIVSELIRRYSI